MKILIPALALGLLALGCNNQPPPGYSGVVNVAINAKTPQERIAALDNLVRYHWQEPLTIQVLERSIQKDPDQTVRETAKAYKVAVELLVQKKKKDDDETTNTIILMS